MAKFLARRVYDGKLSFDDVPEKFQEDVRKILKEEYNYENMD